MRWGFLAGVALALAAAGSRPALGQPLCFEDLDATAAPARTEVRLGIPERPPPDRRDRRSKRSKSDPTAVKSTSGAVTLDGGNPAVYGGYVGCGERVDLAPSSAHGRLSYARSQDWDPWKRLDGDPFAAEHFLDAAVEAPSGKLVEGGYALNMYTRESPSSWGYGNDRATTRSVGGGAMWLSGFDERIRLDTALGMAEPTGDGDVSTAQRHALQVEPVRFGPDGALFANLSFTETDPGYMAGDGAVMQDDTRVWSVGTGLHTTGLKMQLNYRRGRDNLSDDAWRASRSYGEWIGQVDLDAPLGGLLAPDLISFHGNVRRDYQTCSDDLAIATDRQIHASSGWGVNMLWRDDRVSTGIDFSERLADDSALASAGVLPSQRLGLSLGAEAGDLGLSGRLYTERQRLARYHNEDVAMDYGGTLALALLGQRLEASTAYGRTIAHGMAPGLRWGLAAELDAIDLFGPVRSNRWVEDVFALGRLESQFAEDTTGWRSTYIAKVVAGFHF